MAEALVSGAAGSGTTDRGPASWRGRLWDWALDVAVAEFDLKRVRLAQEAILARAEGDRAMLREVADLLSTDAVASLGVACLVVEAGLDREGPLTVPWRELAAFERYHLRALARLHRARDAFEAAWSAREAIA